MRKHDWKIIGAGFVGSTVAERIASQLNQSVLLIDRRNHIAGNAYDRVNNAGHLIHQYGPHIFHTNSTRVSNYISGFTDWMDYEHRVVGLINGRLVPIPFNLTSIDILFRASDAARLKEKLIGLYGVDKKVPILDLKKSDDPEIVDFAQFVYENVFEGYTRKQWGFGPEELSPSVTGRVPVHISYDDRYFQDTFQKMPKDGYTKLIQKMISRPEIDVDLNSSIPPNELIKDNARILYTGAIDEFFNYCYGPLEYRSLEFDFQTYKVSKHQSVAQVNYPNSHDFTRITEFKQLTGQRGDSTTVAIEYPRDHVPGITTPYYPVPRDANKLLYDRYQKLASEEAPHIVFAGRLADYQYYNMDQAIGRALAVFDKQIVPAG